MFTRLKGDRRASGGLIIELPFLTCKRMAEVFGRGAGLSTQKKEKYSNSISVHHQETGEDLWLYMSFGEWRIGGDSNCSVLGELMELLCPVEYKGFGALSPRTIREGCTHGVPDEALQKLCGL